MTNDQIAKLVAVEESSKSAHKRIDSLSKVADSMRELAQNVAALTAEIKMSRAQIDKDIADIRKSQKKQGQRFGDAISELQKEVIQIKRNEKDIADIVDKVDEIRLAPGKNWKLLVGAIIGCVVSVGVTLLLGNFIY